MGAHSYCYYTKYQPDLNAALQNLRSQEFQAGRYNPVIPFPDYPITPNSPTPGAQHLSMEDALMAVSPDGTRSIIDIMKVSNKPCPLSSEEFESALLGEIDNAILGEIFCTAFPLTSDELIALFNTEKPTHEMVDEVILGNTNLEASDDFWDSIQRGTARYIILYEAEQPVEIFFVGFSCD
jgi:hypothetical protein